MDDIKRVLHFPDGFLWGSATSAYQIEGGIDYNDWVGAARAGTVPLAGAACDHYNRYEEDFTIAEGLSQNAHRFSIEWSRIEIEDGHWDLKEIEHYRNVLQELRDRNIIPFVTLHHFTSPVWLTRIGGWENRKTPEYFARYVEFVVDKLKDLVSYWITINEPTVYVGESYMRGAWPPHAKSFIRGKMVNGNLLSAHKRAYKSIKRIQPSSQVGIAHHIVWFAPANTRSFFDKSIANIMMRLENSFLVSIRGYQDFIGLNYYRPRRISFSITNPKGFFMKDKPRGETSDMGWEIWPQGIYHALKNLTKYHIPIYITENGIADEGDTRRERFIHDHLVEVHHAIQEGVPVMGYFHWSLLDNFEWAHGFSKRFGLVSVNFLTQERTIRPSAYTYAGVCKRNTLIW